MKLGCESHGGYVLPAVLCARANDRSRRVAVYFVDCGLCPRIYSRVEARFLVRIRLGPDAECRMGLSQLPDKMYPDDAAGLSLLSLYFYFSQVDTESALVRAVDEIHRRS